MIDRDQLEDTLFGLQLICIFAFVGLAGFSLGWTRGSEATSTYDSAMQAVMIQTGGIAPYPSWLRIAFFATVAILLIAVAVDVWLVLEDDDVDVSEWLRDIDNK